MNEVDTGRDRASPASVRHDDDEPLTPISPCYCTRAHRSAHLQEAGDIILRRKVGLLKAKAMNEVDAGHDRATPASVRRAVGNDALGSKTYIFLRLCFDVFVKQNTQYSTNS